VSESGNFASKAEKQTSPSANRARPPIAVLMIFDGWGLRSERAANATAMARGPTMERLCQAYAQTAVDASENGRRKRGALSQMQKGRGARARLKQSSRHTPVERMTSSSNRS